MTWYAIYQNNDGKLVSTGEADKTPTVAGTTALVLATKPDFQSQVWDESTKVFVVRPAKVLIDRWNDLQANPNYQGLRDGYTTLSAANKTKLQTDLIRLLGSRRYRGSGESVEL